MVIDLGPEFPILLFPIRIETKYTEFNPNEQKGKIRIRFFPDQIGIDSFDPRLTEEEVTYARIYWETLKSLRDLPDDKFIEQRNLAWQELVRRFGCARSAYIAKSVIIYEGETDPDPRDPDLRPLDSISTRNDDEHLPIVCKTLPRFFIVHARFKNTSLAPLEIACKETLKETKLSPFYTKITTIPDPNISTNPFESIDPDLKWLGDFDAAVEIGMAVEIELNKEQYESGFQYLIVYGVQDNLTPQQTAFEIQSLFKAHRYTDGFSFLKQGAPTNLTKGKSGEYSSSPQPDPNVCRSIEFSALNKDIPGAIIDFVPDGRVFEKAVGIGSLAQGVQDANNTDQIDAQNMATALWPVALGCFFENFVDTSLLLELLPQFELPKLRYHFIKYVKAHGSIPPIRIGKVPYGILPVTKLLFDDDLFGWEDLQIIPNTDHIRNFFLALKNRWTKEIPFIDEVPTVMKTSASGGPSPTPPPTENLLNILSMDARSHSYLVRGARSVSYIAEYLRQIPPFNNIPITTFPSMLMARNRDYARRILRLTFDLGREFLNNLYSLVLGSGIADLAIPMVKFSPDSHIIQPNYIQEMYDDIDGPDKNFLKLTRNQHGLPDYPPLLYKLLRYSASFMGNHDESHISEFKESLLNLYKIGWTNADKLESLMLHTLDLTSYRLDAWLTSFANQRLESVRNTNDIGLYMGAFGWIENLMPKDFGQSSTKAVDQGGYIHAPSHAHAAAAAVLRNGYLTHSNESDKKDLLKVNLTSGRTKNALEIIQGIQSIPLAELLGYKLERRFHDAAIDYIIDEFRRNFPLKKDDLIELKDAVEEDSSKERIVPRNLTDGLLVYKNWKRLIDSLNGTSIEEFMNNDEKVWKPFLNDISKYGASTIINQIKPHLNYLLDIVDALSDLCIAESVYQAINGNYDRCASVLEGLSGDGQIPTPEISSTPRSGLRQTQRIVFTTQAESLSSLNLLDVDLDSKTWENPRKLAEPNLNKILESYYGDILFWIDLKDDNGNITSPNLEVTLSDLELEPIDLLYIQEGELKRRLKYYGKTRSFECDVDNYNKKPSKDKDDINKKSFSELQLLIRSLQEIVGQGQPLKYNDFGSIEDNGISGDDDNILREIFQRFYDILFLLAQTIKELEFVKANNDITSTIDVNNKKQALMRASLFGILSAIPLDRYDNILNSVADLNERIELTIRELIINLGQFTNYIDKLREWRSRLMTEGENSLLDSLSQIRLDGLIDAFKAILKNKSFLVLPPIQYPFTSPNDFKTSDLINKKGLKWIQKTAYVRPRLKLFDDVITFNEIFESARFLFYYDETKFNLSVEELLKQENMNNPVSIIVATSSARIETEEDEEAAAFPPPPEKKLAGLVIDEWVEKIPSPKVDTAITFHYDSPNSEAPQSLLLAVSSNDQHRWNENKIKEVILEALELAKIRAVDYRSMKDLRHFFSTIVLNSFGGDIYTKLYDGGLS